MKFKTPDIIEVPNQALLLYRNSSYESYIYVVLPCKDETYLDSIFRTNKGVVAWKFYPYQDGNRYYVSELLSSAKYEKMLDEKDFFEFIQKKFPEDLEFFLWHPEIRDGKWFRDGIIKESD